MTTARALTSRTRHVYWPDVLLPFLLSRLMIFVTGVLAISFGDMRPETWPMSGRPWIDMWARWDSGFYLSIAGEVLRNNGNTIQTLDYLARIA